jgi:predicted GNAT family N-acyltransferase|tara:strand:+ start:3906 stop:4328 length:423 start_codon:yes stop_codon:yes gene_type:complete
VIEIKKILFEDSENMKKCFSIRKEVFIEEQRCDPNDEYENEEESIHFLLTKDKIPCATARYRETDKGIKMERFAVLESQRGKGYGLEILKAIIDDVSAIKCVKYLHAQVQVVKFYEKVGFKKTGRAFDEVGIMHYKMVLN